MINTHRGKPCAKKYEDHQTDVVDRTLPNRPKSVYFFVEGGLGKALAWLSGRIWYVNSTPWIEISPRNLRLSISIPVSMSISGKESIRLNTRCAAPAALVKLFVPIDWSREQNVRQTE